MKPEALNDRDFELISAMLDGQLSGSELQAAQKKLASTPALKQAYDELKIQSAMLRRLPRHKPPRNYMLKAEEVKNLKPGWLKRFMAPALSFASLATMVVILLTYAFQTQLLDMNAAVPKAADATTEMIVPTHEASMLAYMVEEKPEPLIIWGAPKRNYGSGGASLAMGVGGGSDLPPAMTAKDFPAPAMPEQQEGNILQEPAAELQLSNSPTIIFGIPPKEEQGKITYVEPVGSAEPTREEQQEERLKEYDLKEVRLYLVVLMIGLATGAYYIRKKLA